MKRIFLFFFLIFLFAKSGSSQVNWSVDLGGGISNFKHYSQSELIYKYKGDYLLEGGVLVSAKFRKDGILSWQTGILINNAGYKRARSGTNGIKWDWENAERIRNWSLKVPFSFLFYVFEPIGLSFGPHIHYMLDSGVEENFQTEYKIWIPGFNMGLYTPLGKQFLVTAQVSSDIIPRMVWPTDTHNPNRFRDLSCSIHLSYRLNP